jgi:hypothetical protein
MDYIPAAVNCKPETTPPGELDFVPQSLNALLTAITISSKPITVAPPSEWPSAPISSRRLEGF